MLYEEIRNVLKHLSSYANIVTTKLDDSVDGFTASWMMQCSAEPPCVAIAVKKTHRSYELIRRANHFAVNILASGQTHIAEHFFGLRKPSVGKFEGFPYEAKATGSPILVDALAYIDCKLISWLEFGDHAIFVGEVMEAKQQAEGQPLHLDESGWGYKG